MEYPKKPKIIIQMLSTLFGAVGVLLLIFVIKWVFLPISNFDSLAILFGAPLLILSLLPIRACYYVMKQYSQKSVSKLWSAVSIYLFFILVTYDDRILHYIYTEGPSKHHIENFFFLLCILVACLFFRIGNRYLKMWVTSTLNKEIT